MHLQLQQKWEAFSRILFQNFPAFAFFNSCVVHCCGQVTDLALKPVLAGSPECPAEAVHGSYLRNWSSIKQQGLSRMNRTHIHLAPGLPGEDGVISGNLLLLCVHVCRTDVGWTNISTLFYFLFLFPGMRKDCDLAVFVDVPKALAGIFIHLIVHSSKCWMLFYV